MSATSKSLKAGQSQELTRRQFIAGTSASALAFSVLKPELVRGAEANSKITVGLIGCGGRGKFVADYFAKHGSFQLVAVTDYFQDRIDDVGQKFQVPPAQRYSGLMGYRRLLEQKLDVVAIETPPYFHPEQVAEAVDAGKHVYIAKPLAVDVPGCLSIEASGKKATAKKLCFLVDFQTRAHPAYQEVAQRIKKGDIGRIVNAEAAYQTSTMFAGIDAQIRRDPSNKELRLRGWAVDRVLSGDVITEQNIHALDVATWLLDGHPLRAYGSGGRARDFVGTCWDHYAVIFYFPNDVLLSFNAKQVGHGYDDIMCRVYGMNGYADTHYSGKVTLRSKDEVFNGDTSNLYADGVVRNVAEFYRSLTQGDYSNPTVAPSVRSNLTAIVGRTAAYKGGEVTWDEVMKTNEKWVADLKGLKA